MNGISVPLCAFKLQLQSSALFVNCHFLVLLVVLVCITEKIFHPRLLLLLIFTSKLFLTKNLISEVFSNILLFLLQFHQKFSTLPTLVSQCILCDVSTFACSSAGKLWASFWSLMRHFAQCYYQMRALYFALWLQVCRTSCVVLQTNGVFSTPGCGRVCFCVRRNEVVVPFYLLPHFQRGCYSRQVSHKGTEEKLILLLISWDECPCVVKDRWSFQVNNFRYGDVVQIIRETHQKLTCYTVLKTVPFLQVH